MKKITITIFAVLLHVIVFAQSGEAMKKIEAARIGFITERLNLTPQQAEKFWPIYNEFIEKRRGLVAEYREERKALKDEGEISDEESKTLIEKGLEMKEKNLALERTYIQKLDGIITSQQILELRKAEEDFRKMLLRRLENRRDQRDRFKDR